MIPRPAESFCRWQERTQRKRCSSQGRYLHGDLFNTHLVRLEKNQLWSSRRVGHPLVCFSWCQNRSASNLMSRITRNYGPSRPCPTLSKHLTPYPQVGALSNLLLRCTKTNVDRGRQRAPATEGNDCSKNRSSVASVLLDNEGSPCRSLKAETV